MMLKGLTTEFCNSDFQITGDQLIMMMYLVRFYDSQRHLFNPNPSIRRASFFFSGCTLVVPDSVDPSSACEATQKVLQCVG